MSCYVIGDVQGCFQELNDLLDDINFDPSIDWLIFAGDIINRGPDSLSCLKFVKDNTFTKMVLGNHDLHLLAVAEGVRKPHRKDTLEDILVAKDKDVFIAWLRQQELLIHHEETNTIIVHAGIPPDWDLNFATRAAKETCEILRCDSYYDFIQSIYGNEPDQWNESLCGNERYRYIINAFTRMRYCYPNKRLEFSEKGAPGKQYDGLTPWFAHKKRKHKEATIVFGHWSTVLQGNINDFSSYNVIPIDTGCLWGGKLSALRLEDRKLFSVPSRQKILDTH